MAAMPIPGGPDDVADVGMGRGPALLDPDQAKTDPLAVPPHQAAQIDYTSRGHE